MVKKIVNKRINEINHLFVNNCASEINKSFVNKGLIEIKGGPV